jgi:putative transposase
MHRLLNVPEDLLRRLTTVDWGISGLYVTRLLDIEPPSSAANRWPCEPTTVRSSPAGPSWPGAQAHRQAHSYRAWKSHVRTATSRALSQVQARTFKRAMLRDAAPGHIDSTIRQQDYNKARPHSSIGRLPPSCFAELHHKRTGDEAQSASLLRSFNGAAPDFLIAPVWRYGTGQDEHT